MIFNVWFGDALLFTQSLITRPEYVTLPNQLIINQTFLVSLKRSSLTNILPLSHVFLDKTKIINRTFGNQLLFLEDFRKTPYTRTLTQNLAISQNINQYVLNNLLTFNQNVIPTLTKKIINQMLINQTVSYNFVRNKILPQTLIIKSSITAYLVSTRFVGSPLKDSTLLGRDDCV